MSQFDVERLLLMTGANGARGPESEPCLKAQSPPAQGRKAADAAPCPVSRERNGEGRRRGSATRRLGSQPALAARHYE